LLASLHASETWPKIKTGGSLSQQTTDHGGTAPVRAAPGPGFSTPTVASTVCAPVPPSPRRPLGPSGWPPTVRCLQCSTKRSGLPPQRPDKTCCPLRRTGRGFARCAATCHLPFAPPLAPDTRAAGLLRPGAAWTPSCFLALLVGRPSLRKRGGAVGASLAGWFAACARVPRCRVSGTSARWRYPCGAAAAPCVLGCRAARRILASASASAAIAKHAENPKLPCKHGRNVRVKEPPTCAARHEPTPRTRFDHCGT